MIELDFETDPTLVDYNRLLSASDRRMPALEWAALHQVLDTYQPFIGTE